MIYLLCIIVPPLAVLLKGKPVQALLNLVLTMLGWIPGVIHAILVVNKVEADRRHHQLMEQSERHHQEAMRRMQEQPRQ